MQAGIQAACVDAGVLSWPGAGALPLRATGLECAL